MTRRRRAIAAAAALITLVVVAVLALAYAPRHRDEPGRDAWSPAPAVPGSQPPPTSSSPVPEGALVVALDGDDSATGTASRPLRTIGVALARAGTGGTVVVRAGAWHESLHIDSAVTLRSWPGEHVWLDGSLPLDPAAFTPAPPARDGSAVWRLDGYSIALDTSPTFTRGAPDNTEPGWRFIDPAHPLAADPQQIWRGDTPLRQVGEPAAVTTGTFYVDSDARALYVGADPGGSAPLAAGAISKALLITAPGARVEGIGIRRYVPSLPDFGAVTVDGPGSVLRDVLVTASSTIGVSVQTREVSLERVTVRESGMLGLHAHLADSLRLIDVAATGNNTQLFNPAPAAGGAKITMSRDLRVDGGRYSGNRGNGLWLDESVVDSDIVGVDAGDNLVHGIQVELCAGIDLLRVVAARNGGIGVSVQNSDHVRIWNTTAAANRRQIAFVQDGRRPTDPGAESRLLHGSNGTPTWVIGDSEVVNSVLADSTGPGDGPRNGSGDGPRNGSGGGPRNGPGGSDRPRAVSEGDTLFAVEDYTKTLDANDLDIRLRHNAYLRDPRAPRRWTHVWSRSGDHPAVFTTLAAFRRATGQEDGSREGDTRRWAAALWHGDSGGVRIGEPLASYLPADPDAPPPGTIGAGRPLPDPPTREFPRPTT